MRWFVSAIVKPYHPTLLGLPVIALILFFGFRWANPEAQAKSAVTPLECLKIQRGMTEKEVEEILKQRLGRHEAPDDQEATARWSLGRVTDSNWWFISTPRRK
jgi:hypothetical protein